MMFLDKIETEEIFKIKELLEESWQLNNECWEWPFQLNSGGYGIYKKYLVHRLSYAIFVNDFHKSNFICHHCDNPRCYNPKHLYAGDHKTNARDALKRDRYSVTRSIYTKSKKELN